MKIAVTGSTGFIGHHVVQWLVSNNYDVIASGTSEEKAKNYSWYDKITFIPCDYFSDDVDYYHLFGSPDILIHCAWKGLPNHQMRFHLDQNLPVEMRFLHNISKDGKTKIVVIGTCQEYGIVNGCISETNLTNPVTAYGIAKDTLCRYLDLLSQEYGFSWNWIRVFYLYGNEPRPKSLLSQLEKAIADGDVEFPLVDERQIRDYLPIERCAEYICKIALQNKINGIINCCSGHGISLVKLVENEIAKRSANIKVKPGVYRTPVYEGEIFWGDITKLTECLGEFK